MATEEEIKAEIEELGRLTPEQEDMLYLITLRQDELGRQPTTMLLDDFLASPLYQGLVEREYLTYDEFTFGNKKDERKVASLYVTLKGMRYCILFADELNERKKR